MLPTPPRRARPDFRILTLPPRPAPRLLAMSDDTWRVGARAPAGKPAVPLALEFLGLVEFALISCLSLFPCTAKVSGEAMAMGSEGNVVAALSPFFPRWH